MKSQRIAGIALLAIGAVLLTVSAAYYAYGAFQKTQVGKLEFEAARPVAPLDPGQDTLVAPAAASEPTTDQPVETSVPAMPSPSLGTAQVTRPQTYNESPTDDKVSSPPSEEPSQAAATSPTDREPEPSAADSSETALAPVSTDGTTAAPTGAMDTLQAPAGVGDPTTAYRPPSPLERVRGQTGSYSAPTYADAAGLFSPATRMNIPSISVDSSVKGLKVEYFDESYAWETPKHTVGYIPTTAKPGDQGQGWYFGHLESPIAGEGNVFFRLPEIPALLKDGETVVIELESDGRLFTYQVYKTEVVHERDLVVTDSGQSDITLVACWPRFVYDHRILVTAALVGLEELPPSGDES